MEWGVLICLSMCVLSVAGQVKVLKHCFSDGFKYKEFQIACMEPRMVKVQSAEYYSLHSASCPTTDVTKTVTLQCQRAVNCSMPLPYNGDIRSCLKCIKVTIDCVPAMCSKPPLPVFGTGNLTSEARVKSVVGYSCQQDFKLSGSTSGLCTLSTNWNLKGLKLESLYGWKHMTQPTCSLDVKLCSKPRSPTVYPTGTYEGNCLEFVKINKTKQEAKADCTAKGGSLLGGAKYLYLNLIIGSTTPAVSLTKFTGYDGGHFWIDKPSQSPTPDTCHAIKFLINRPSKPDIHHITTESCSDKLYYICKYVVRKPPRCGKFEIPKFGHIATQDGDLVGDKVTLGCLEGYQLDGSHERTCQDDGTWSGTSPKCKVVDCGIPPFHSGGNQRRFYESTGFFSLVEYSCDEGYELVGESASRCTATGRWSDPPACRKKTGSFKSATKCAHETKERHEEWLHVTCAKPYMLKVENVQYYNDKNVDCIDLDYSKNARANCDRLLNCSFPVPFKGYPTNCLKCISVKYDCVLAKCPKLPIPSFASTNVSEENREAPFRTVAKFTCNGGFSMQGTGIRSCLLFIHLLYKNVFYSQYRWIGIMPTCSLSASECPTRTMADKYPVATLGGSCIDFISVSKSWSDAKASCEARGGQLFKQADVTKLSAPFKSASPAVKLRTISSFTKREDYWTGQTRRNAAGEMECLSIIYTNKNFIGSYISPNWKSCGTNHHYICEYVQHRPERCSDLYTPPNAIRTGDDFSIGSKVTFSCIDGYRLNGTAERTCMDDGEWSNKNPSCTVIDCGAPPLDGSGVMMVHVDLTQAFHEAFFFCASDHQLDGPRVRVCQETGQWSGAKPRCVPKVKTEPPSMKGGLGKGALIAAILVPILVVALGIIIVVILIKRGAVNVPLIPQQQTKADGLANPVYVNFKKDGVNGTEANAM